MTQHYPANYSSGIMKNKDDSFLVAQVKRGDKKAYETLFYRYSERIYYFSYKYLCDQHMAEEITQEVFVKIWINREQLRQDLSFKCYLFMVTRNAVIDTYRKRKNHLDACREFETRLNNLVLMPDQIYEYNHLTRILNDFVATLPDRRQKIYQLSRDKGYTHKEIAKELGISVKTVETHIRLAIKHLRNMVEQNYSSANIGLGGMIFIHFFI